MKLIRVVARSVADGFTRRFQQQPPMLRTFSTSFPADHTTSSNESLENFEQRILGDDGWKNSAASDSFYKKLDSFEKTRSRTNFASKLTGGDTSEAVDELKESITNLPDGMDGKLKKAATYFNFTQDEMIPKNFPNRPDARFGPGNTFGRKDFDLRRSIVPKPFKRTEFTTTTEEALRKADFRNVRFLANFVTEAGIIKKRSTTKISAKAQRKIAREIKTARAFGLMPFTTMGTKKFVFGKTMEALDDDFEYDTYDANSFEDEEENEDS